MREWARAGPWALPWGALLLLAAGPPAPGPQFTDITQDRKSTRLNSSHVSTPYAVVCLKKKKRILGSRTALSRFFARHGITAKINSGGSRLVMRRRRLV